VVTRTLYKVVNPDEEDKKLEAVQVRLGISDGFFTEVLGGLAEGDTVVTNITMPGATAASAPQGGMQNPFSGGSRGGPPGSSGMRGPR
jgi:multidrug efflux pump subunit AcrA (membrane-fusion protein)